MSLDMTFADRTENSLRADIQPPEADLPQSALGSLRSQTPSKMLHTKGVHHKQHLLEALAIIHVDAEVTYCYQRTPERL
jgi:hypothetical protein